MNNYSDGLIVIEGVDGTGKSTVCRLLNERLLQMGITNKVIPGLSGCGYADDVKKKLLENAKTNTIVPNALVHLLASAFFQTIDTVIAPAIDDDILVIADRYVDSMRVYQYDSPVVDVLCNNLMTYFNPSHVFILDAGVRTLQSRIIARQDNDAMDSTETLTLLKYRNRYLNLYAGSDDLSYQTRYHLIDASASPEEIVNIILKALEPLIEQYLKTLKPIASKEP